MVSKVEELARRLSEAARTYASLSKLDPLPAHFDQPTDKKITTTVLAASPGASEGSLYDEILSLEEKLSYENPRQARDALVFALICRDHIKNAASGAGDEFSAANASRMMDGLVAFLEEISETSAKSLGLDWYSVPEMAEKKNKPQARAGEGKSSTVPQAGAGA